MAAHRYWRLLFDNPLGAQNWGIAEIAWKATAGGSNLATVGANASAGTIFNSTFSAAKAIDGNTATAWVSGGNFAGEWWEYDFVTATDIAEITITGDGFHTAPALAEVQYSDNNSTWTTSWAALTSATWTTGTKTFTRSAPLVGGHRWWRVKYTTNGGSNGSASGLAMRAISGGGNVCLNGLPLSDSVFTGGFIPFNAFDNTLSTCWVAATTPPTSWVGFDFGEGNAPNIVEIALTARNDGAFTQAPTAAEVDYSDDGSTWTSAWSFTASGWTIGQTKVFTEPGPSVGALLFTGYAPLLAESVATPSDPLSFTGLAPLLAETVAPPVGASLFTGHAPLPTVGAMPPAGMVSFTGLAPLPIGTAEPLPLLVPTVASDLLLQWDNDNFRADMVVQNGDLAVDQGLRTAWVISLMTDALAPPDAVIPDGTDDRRGTWMDLPLDTADDPAQPDHMGSLLWLLSREKQVPEVLRRAENYIRQATQWMITDGIATRIDAVASFPRMGWIRVNGTLWQGDTPTAYDDMWQLS